MYELSHNLTSPEPAPSPSAFCLLRHSSAHIVDFAPQLSRVSGSDLVSQDMNSGEVFPGNQRALDSYISCPVSPDSVR